jgi:hypothetical protein
MTDHGVAVHDVIKYSARNLEFGKGQIHGMFPRNPHSPYHIMETLTSRSLGKE